MVVPPELLLELPPLLLLLLVPPPELLLVEPPPLLLLLLVWPPLLLLLLLVEPPLLLLLLLVWPPLLLLLLVPPPELLLVEPPLLLLLLLEMPPLLLLPTELAALVETVPEPVHADNAPSNAQQTPRARICLRFTAGICMAFCSLIVPPSHCYSRSQPRQSVPKTRRGAAYFGAIPGAARMCCASQIALKSRHKVGPASAGRRISPGRHRARF